MLDRLIVVAGLLFDVPRARRVAARHQRVDHVARICAVEFLIQIDCLVEYRHRFLAVAGAIERFAVVQRQRRRVLVVFAEDLQPELIGALGIRQRFFAFTVGAELLIGFVRFGEFGFRLRRSGRRLRDGVRGRRRGGVNGPPRSARP